jgi:hypothetical protein
MKTGSFAGPQRLLRLCGEYYFLQDAEKRETSIADSYDPRNHAKGEEINARS